MAFSPDWGGIRFHIDPDSNEGIQVLALEALRIGDEPLLERLELKMISRKGIHPIDAYGSPIASGAKPRGIRKGCGELLVVWNFPCKECDGYGGLHAQGATKRFEIECPECDGSGELDSDGTSRTEILTDIDGRFIGELYTLVP